MLEWFVPENTGIAAIIIISVSVIIAVLMRKRSIEYLKSGNKQKSQTQLYEQLKLQLSKKSPNCHPNPMESGQPNHSQSIEPHQEQETNKKERELNQE